MPYISPVLLILAAGVLFSAGAIGSGILAIHTLRENEDRAQFGFGVSMMLFFTLATLGVTAIFRAYTMSWMFPVTSPAMHDMNLVLYPSFAVAVAGTVLCFIPAFREYRRQLAAFELELRGAVLRL